MPATCESIHAWSNQILLVSGAFLMVNESPLAMVAAASVAPIAVPVATTVSRAGGIQVSPQKSVQQTERIRDANASAVTSSSRRARAARRCCAAEFCGLRRGPGGGSVRPLSTSSAGCTPRAHASCAFWTPGAEALRAQLLAFAWYLLPNPRRPYRTPSGRSHPARRPRSSIPSP
jgi:hypothetical protein